MIHSSILLPENGAYEKFANFYSYTKQHKIIDIFYNNRFETQNIPIISIRLFPRRE